MNLNIFNIDENFEVENCKKENISNILKEI